MCGSVEREVCQESIADENLVGKSDRGWPPALGGPLDSPRNTPTGVVVRRPGAGTPRLSRSVKPKSSPARTPGRRVKKISELFGGARHTKVRTPNSNIKTCTRSRADKCLLHKCMYVEIDRTERRLEKTADGKIGMVDKSCKVWVCNTQIGAGTRGQNSVSGAKKKGERLSEGVSME